MMAVELQIHGHFFSTWSKHALLVKNCITLPALLQRSNFFNTFN